MIGGRGYQTLGPHCVLAPEHCSAIPVGSPYRLPAARGPPQPQAQDLSADRHGRRADCDSCQT
jgi:hypothetical protein